MSLDPAVAAVLRTGFSLLLAGAAWHKLRHLRQFELSLSNYQIVPRPLVLPVAVLLALFELVLAAGLWRASTTAAAAQGIAALMLVYAAAIAVSVQRGRVHDCGCGGIGGSQPVSPALVWRNLALAALAMLIALPQSDRPLLWVDAVTIAGGAIVAVMLFAALDTLIANRRGGGKGQGTKGQRTEGHRGEGMLARGIQ